MRAASKLLSMPLSRSEFIFFASLSDPAGSTAIWFEMTSSGAIDFAMDSAWALSASAPTCPVSVTTPLSRSWLAETSLKPALSSEARILSATLAARVEPAEQAARAPATTITSKNTYGLKAFILLSFDATSVTLSFRAWKWPNVFRRNVPVRLPAGECANGRQPFLARRIFSARGLDALQNCEAQKHNCAHRDPMRG